MREIADLAAAEDAYNRAVRAHLEAARAAPLAAGAVDAVRHRWSNLRNEEHVDPETVAAIRQAGSEAEAAKAETAATASETQTTMEEAGQRLADVRNRLALAGRRRYREALRQDGDL